MSENEVKPEEKNWEVGYEEIGQRGKIYWVPDYAYSQLGALFLANDRNLNSVSLGCEKLCTWYARKKPE
jgi:hypothetical protein